MNTDSKLVNQVTGVLKSGYGVASGRAKDSQFPAGTIVMQAPVFKQLGLDLTGFFLGTLNIDIAPTTWQPIKPWQSFLQVKWWDGYPPEDFSFFRCGIILGDTRHQGFVYYPSPATKVSEFQPPTVLEILATWIPGLQVGDQVRLETYSTEIELYGF